MINKLAMFHYPDAVFNKSTIKNLQILCVNVKRFVVYVTRPASIPLSSVALEAET